jgi:hypothetical protein
VPRQPCGCRGVVPVDLYRCRANVSSIADRTLWSTAAGALMAGRAIALTGGATTVAVANAVLASCAALMALDLVANDSPEVAMRLRLPVLMACHRHRRSSPRNTLITVAIPGSSASGFVLEEGYTATGRRENTRSPRGA